MKLATTIALVVLTLNTVPMTIWMSEDCGLARLNRVHLDKITHGISVPTGGSDRFRLEGSYTDIDEDFNPAVGYVRRTGVRQFRGEARWVPYAPKIRNSTNLDGSRG